MSMYLWCNITLILLEKVRFLLSLNINISVTDADIVFKQVVTYAKILKRLPMDTLAVCLAVSDSVWECLVVSGSIVQ